MIQECRSTCAKSGVYKQNLKSLTYLMFLDGNTHADSLATLAMSSAQDLPRVILVEDLCTLTLLHQGMPRIHQIKLGLSWMDSISLFMEKNILPEEKSEAEKVRRKAPRFWLSEDKIGRASCRERV